MEIKCRLLKKSLVIAFTTICVLFLIRCSKTSEYEKPNIIIFYVDDLGYGDVGCYGARGVATPNIDSLAMRGIRFTDAHCSSATCTPSRFSLLTGLYAFRNRAEILPGDAPLLIDTSKITLPKMLKKEGYNTAIVGKWHLGLGSGKIDWNRHISPGANEIGFDYSFLIPATGDRVPTVFVENGDVVNKDDSDPILVDYVNRVGSDPVGSENEELLKMKADAQHSNTVVNGVSRIGFMSGGKNARWIDEHFPTILNEKATEFMDGSNDKPFFLFYSFHDIHVPRLPNEKFKGKSSMGPRGDAIAQVDWVVGEIVSFLRSTRKLDNTLIIFTSDNGPVLNDGYSDQAAEFVGPHKPGGEFRGGKYSAYEAGTRVPTILYWKGHVLAKVSEALISQVDLLSSLASLVGSDLSTDRLDSESQLHAWLGNDSKGREVLLEESFTLSIRKGNWKYIKPFEGNTPSWLANKNIEGGLSSEEQLFNLTEDPAESKNLAKRFPEKSDELDLLIHSILENKN
jgi:arylsulfatase A